MAGAESGARIRQVSALVLGAIFLVIAGIIFTLLYYAFPANSHFLGLLAIGIVSLGFSILCYLAQGLSRNPIGQRSLAYGFLGMGFTILLVTTAVGTNPSLSTTDRLEGLVVILVALGIAVLGVMWRLTGYASERARGEQREAWRRTPPLSAFAYPPATTAPAPPGTSAPEDSSTRPPQKP